MPQDPLAVSPKDYKLELENEWVRVLRLKQEPHERVAVHEEPAVVVVYLTPARQRFTGADGKVREISKKAGEVAYLDAGKRAEENASGCASRGGRGRAQVWGPKVEGATGHARSRQAGS